MKRLLVLVPLAGLLAGCAVSSPNGNARTVYAPGVLNGRIGEVIRVEDEDAVFWYRIGASGGTILLGSALKPESKLSGFVGAAGEK